MTLTAKQHVDIIRAHWKLLWPLPAKERMRVLDELILDYEFEDQLRRVTEQMSCVSMNSITTSPSQSHSLEAC